MFLFIETLEPTGVFTVLDKFILLLSGALHDMDHMGLAQGRPKLHWELSWSPNSPL